MLDVACGPGIVVCAIAGLAREAVGIDVTPAMIEAARKLATDRGIVNVDWRVGEIPPLPWDEASFEVVVSRYAFHHFEQPAAVLAEMVRVCVPGGRVVVCDVAPAADKAAAFNAVERLRDSSHANALSVEQLLRLFAGAGLDQVRVSGYGLAGDLDSLLARSFPGPDGEQEVRRRFEASLADDSLGVDARRDGEQITYRFPIAILAAVKGN